MSIQPISVSELARLIESSAPPMQLVDVREQWEYELGHIAGSIHIPLNRIVDLWQSLASDRDAVIICHHGIRSRMACEFLALHDFKQLFNLEGGINAWSIEIDASVPQY